MDKSLEQELRMLVEKFKSDFNDYQKEAQQEWDSYDATYFEGACSAIDTVIVCLEQLLEKHANSTH